MWFPVMLIVAGLVEIVAALIPATFASAIVFGFGVLMLAWGIGMLITQRQRDTVPAEVSHSSHH